MVRESSTITTTGMAGMSQAWRKSSTPSRTIVMSSRPGLMRSGKLLDTWHRFEDNHGSVYFVQPVGNYIGNVRREERTGRTVVSIPIQQKQQRVLPSGYSPNRFPVMAHRTHAEDQDYQATRAVVRQTPTSLLMKGHTIAVDRSSEVHGSQPKENNNWSSMYFGEESTVSSCSVPSVYENVPKNSQIFGNNKKDCGAEAEHLLNGSFPSNSRIISAEKVAELELKSKMVREGGRYRKPVADGVLAAKAAIPDEKKCKKGRRKTPKFIRLFSCCCMGPIERRKVKSDASSVSDSAKLGGNIITVNNNAINTGSLSQYDGANSIITQVTKESLKNSCSNGTSSDINDPFKVDDGVDYCAPIIENLLLPPLRQCDQNKKCLIVDLDETLVHSSFKPVKNPDFVIPVEIGNTTHQVYVLKRPYVDVFLEKIGDKFECVLFTASLAKYADPVANLLDKQGVFQSRLFREACVFHKGNYVKDLTRLGRDLKNVIIIDNSPASYSFHPENAIPVHSWFSDETDTELLDILPLLDELFDRESVYSVLRNYEGFFQRNSPDPLETSLSDS